MKRITPIILSLAASLFFSPTITAQPSLESAFRSPPPAVRPHTWWHWMNGNITREGITADLEAMKSIGLGGAQIFNVSESIPEGPILYNSPDWRDLVHFAASEAKRLDLELCIHNCAGWSSSGGPWVTPEHAMQTLTFSETSLTGPARFAAALDQPRTNLDFYRDIAVLAFPTPKDDSRIPDINVKALRDYRYGITPSLTPLPAAASIPLASIIDLTPNFKDGKLTWDAPAGNWTVLRIGYTPTGAVCAPAPASGRGLEVDKLSREAFDVFWDGGMEPLIKHLGPLVGTTLKHSLIDSYEMGCQNWTPKFRAEFQKRRGYDPLLFLPVITGRVVTDSPASERFLWDFRRTVSDLFTENYYTYFAERARAHNILTSVEPYDGPFECHQVARDADIVMGEFWTNGGMNESCKLASSVGHTYGKSIIGAEAFTAFPEVGKWMNHPASLKGIGDLMYTVGINRYIVHRYAHQPWTNVNPGMTMGQWGTHFERTTTWWEPGRAWITYLARCQAMLQAGSFAADVLFFAGEASPNNSPADPALKAKGYDYDACGTDILHRLAVKDNRLVLPSGMSYRLLVLPDTTFMTPSLAAKIRDLVNAGATVIGPRPTASPSASGGDAASADVARIGAEVWADCDGVSIKEHAFGKGRVITGRSPADVLASMNITPDCAFEKLHARAANPKIAWIHRTLGDTDIYFLSNQKPRSDELVASFRVAGKAPELWHADSGAMAPAPVWNEQNSRTRIPLQFEPWGSVFVIFKPGSAAAHIVSITPPALAAAAADHKAPVIVIKKAMYEAVDGAGGVDVTAKVAAALAAGETEIPATNGLFGDPTVNHLKRLRVEYTLDGKDITKSANENTSLVFIDTSGPDLPPTYQLRATAAGEGEGGAELIAFEPGPYQIKRTDGPAKLVTVPALPAPFNVQGPWTVRFQKDRGAPEQISMAALSSLSLSSTPGVRYFSGTADYSITFDLPADFLSSSRVLRLDLGAVREIAEVTLNGVNLGVWWKPPYHADVTPHLKPGANQLTVRVTNLWINRLIGDEQSADDCEWNGITIKKWPAWFDPKSSNPLANRPAKDRFTFTTWKHWHKDSPLPDSGLLGPVRLTPAARLKID